MVEDDAGEGFGRDFTHIKEVGYECSKRCHGDEFRGCHATFIPCQGVTMLTGGFTFFRLEMGHSVTESFWNVSVGVQFPYLHCGN